MRLILVSMTLTLFATVLVGCSTPEEIAAAHAAELARVGAEDDGLCRRAGFRSGSEQYRLCRYHRTEKRASEQAYEIAKRAKEDEKRREEEEEEKKEQQAKKEEEERELKKKEAEKKAEEEAKKKREEEENRRKEDEQKIKQTEDRRADRTVFFTKNIGRFGCV